MRIVVLGGSRFVGVHVVDALAAREHEVIAVNRGETRRPMPYPAQATHRRCAREDAKAFLDLAADLGYVDAVVDLCGYDPDTVAANLEALAPRTERYVFVSSVVVYEHFQRTSTPGAEIPLAETSPTIQRPSPNERGDGGYAWDKLRIERLVAADDQIASTVLRPAGIYGCWDTWYRHEYFFDRALAGRPIWMSAAQRPAVVQLTWVGTLVEAIVSACEDAAPPAHRDLNVADAEPVSMIELATFAAEAAGVVPSIEIVSASRYRAAKAQADAGGASVRAWFPFHSTPDFALAVDRLTAELGVVPASTSTGTVALFEDYAARRYDAGPADFALDDLLAGRSREVALPVR